MNANARDVLRFAESHRRPRLAAVGGLPHTVAIGDVAANLRFATTGVNDVRIALALRERADAAAEIFVRDGNERGAAVSGLPDAAACRTEIVFLGPGDRAGDGDHAPGAVRPDV